MSSSFPVTPGLLRDHSNRSPSESDYALIGKIALKQTGLLFQLERLVWYYMEDVDKGHIATARLGSIAITEILETFVEWTEPDDGVAEALSWAIGCFHTLREIRNSIVHGFNFRADRKADKLIIERRTKSLVFDEFQVFEISPSVLERVSTDQTALALYLWKLDYLIQERPEGTIGPNSPPPASPLPLPPRPAEPAALKPVDRESPQSARAQRRASQEKAAKQAKLDRKAQQRADAKKRKK